MKIAIVNDIHEQLEDDISTINHFLLNKNFEYPEMVSISVNDFFVKKAEYNNVHIKNGDKIDLIFLLGGG